MSARVADVMTTNVVAVRKYASFKEIAARLRDLRVFPVVGQNGELLGIISRADVLSVFGRPDKEIRHEIIETVITRHYFTDPGDFTVIVEDGVVTLEGTPENAGVGHGIVSEVRHLEGVVAVHDELAYPAAARERQWGEQASW